MATICPAPANTKRMVRSKPAHASLGVSLFLLGTFLMVGCHGRRQNGNNDQSARHIDFNQDVQPILASRCFSCHGPDPEMRKAGLRLDLGESAFKKRPGHPDAIVPGHPGEKRTDQAHRVEGPALPDAAVAAGRSQAHEGRGNRHPQRVDQRGRGVSAALGIQQADPAATACARSERWAGEDADRWIHPRAAEEGGTDALAGSGQGDPDPARDAGPDGPAAHAGRGARFRER